MADEDKQLTDAENQAAPLSQRERIVAGIVGGAFSIAGIIAILVLGKDGAGSLALVAVGALFLLVAVADIIPSVFKIGSNEMTMRRTPAERFTLRKVEEAQAKEAIGDTEGAKQALESVANPPAPELALASHRTDWVSMRLDVTSYLIRWAERWNARIALFDGYPNIMEVAWQDKSVLVDMHYLEYGPGMLGKMVFNMPSDMSRPTAVLAVFNRAIWAYSKSIPEVERMLQVMYAVPVRSVIWGAKDRYASLEMAVRDLLGIHIRGSPPADTDIGTEPIS